MTTVTWSTADTSGNTATDSQIITVVDTTAPEITSPEDIVVEATNSDGEELSIGDAIASDIGIDTISQMMLQVFSNWRYYSHMECN